MTLPIFCSSNHQEQFSREGFPACLYVIWSCFCGSLCLCEVEAYPVSAHTRFQARCVVQDSTPLPSHWLFTDNFSVLLPGQTVQLAFQKVYASPLCSWGFPALLALALWPPPIPQLLFPGGDWSNVIPPTSPPLFTFSGDCLLSRTVPLKKTDQTGFLACWRESHGGL